MSRGDFHAQFNKDEKLISIDCAGTFCPPFLCTGLREEFFRLSPGAARAASREKREKSLYSIIQYQGKGMEEIIFRIRTDMVIERILFPQGKEPEVLEGLTEEIGDGCKMFDNYEMNILSSLAKQEVVLLTDSFPEQRAGYNDIASFLLKNASSENGKIPVWGNVLLARKICVDPQDKVHFSLGGFSGICLEILEMYLVAAKNQIVGIIARDANRNIGKNSRAPEMEAIASLNICGDGLLRR